MTYFKTLIVGSFLAATASTSIAQSLDPVRVEMFRSILKGNECVMSEALAANILPRFDFTRDETRAIVGALVAAGEVRLDGSTLNLVDGSCEAEDPVAELLGQRNVQQFIAIMAENSCAMSEADAEPIFAARGLDKAQVGAVVGPMMQAGMASFEAGILRVDSAYCAAPVVAEVSPPVVGSPVEMATAPELDRSGMFGMSRVAALVDVMAQNGCTLNMEVADGYLSEVGIEHSFATFIARKMISDGFASMVDAENMVLSAPYCIATGGAAPVLAQVETPVETQVETPESTSVMVESDGTPKGALLATAAQSSCTLNVEADLERLAQAGVRMDQAYRIVDELIADGNASLSDGGALVSFNPVLCGSELQPVEQVEQAQTPVAPTTPDVTTTPIQTAPVQTTVDSTDPRAGVLTMLAANGCEVTQANAAGLVAAAGLDFNTSMQILTQMMGSGEAISPDGGQTLQVGAPLCVAAGVEPMTPREAFINLIKQNNCSITAAEFSSLLPANGLDASTAFGMISELEAEGVISLPATRDVVTLSAEMCR